MKKIQNDHVEEISFVYVWLRKMEILRKDLNI